MESVTYINSYMPDASALLEQALYGLILDNIRLFEETVILCIGTDRATGDCLGPIIGYKLEQCGTECVYGTLEKPVHARNLVSTMEEIELNYNNPLIIAIDSSLGKLEQIGYISVGKGPVQPGAGLNKSLPPVGHIFITGVVNYSGIMDFIILQNTRLNLVMKMADIAVPSITKALKRINDSLRLPQVLEV